MRIDGDERGVVSLRAHLPVLERCTYLNTGAAGPLPRAVSDAVAAMVGRELVEGRVYVGFAEEYATVQERARSSIARALGAAADEITLTGGTGEGLNIVLHGFAWRPGDEIITTTAEHESLLLPLAVLRERHGVVVRFASVGQGGQETVAAIAAEWSARTRLLAFSHVAYATGVALPLERLVALAHERSVPALVDGAQAFAALPLDLPATGVDFYAVPAQKWLCGPAGAGALYIRRAALALLAHTFIGYSSVAAQGAADPYVAHPGARRFEVGTRYLPALAGLAAALDWWRSVVEPAWAYARIQHLADRLIDELQAVPDVEVATPRARHAGLVSLRVGAIPPTIVARRLAHEDGILCRPIPGSPWVRFSTGWYTTRAEIDHAVRALSAMDKARRMDYTRA